MARGEQMDERMVKWMGRCMREWVDGKLRDRRMKKQVDGWADALMEGQVDGC